MVDLDPEAWLKKLLACHDKEKGALAELNSHYEGTMPLSYLHPELLAELDDRLQQVVIAWPELVVDSLDERLDVEGFRLESQADADDSLWAIWQANDLDETSQQGHVDALVMRRAYTIVGANEEPDQPPVVTVESPLEVYLERDPRTREPIAAVKPWCVEDGTTKVDHATLYLPTATSWWVKAKGQWTLDPDMPPDEHGLDFLPVSPIVNRPRLNCPGGRSELASILPLAHAANKIATDMMVSAEFHAMPRRWALGFGPEDFTDENGNRVSTWSKIAGRIWATIKTKQEGAEVGQFPEASLENFITVLNQLARLVGSLGALPPQYMGFTTDNPASADAIRSAESRLVKRAERRQRAFGGGWERTMRIADRISTRVWRPEMRRLETIWRDASTPTVAQKADAAVKLYTAGISTLRQTRRDVSYTVAEIKRMEEEDAEKAAADPIGQMTRALAHNPTAPEPTTPEPEPEPAPTAA